MRISKLETPNFDDFDIMQRAESADLVEMRYRNHEVKLEGVLEVDDVSGRIVRQVRTQEGYPVLTNGADDIYIDNSAKIMMLDPQVRLALMHEGYIPKTTVAYEKNIRIVNKNPGAALASIEEKLDSMEAVTVERTEEFERASEN